jgi:hypothetical protein
LVLVVEVVLDLVEDLAAQLLVHLPLRQLEGQKLQ